MSVNIGGVGLSITVFASITFPQGFTLTEFSTEADPLEMPTDIEITNSQIGLNGDKAVWQVVPKISVGINLMPGTEGDKNMQILANTNRKAKNKVAPLDTITYIISYPDGKTKTCTDGNITVGKIADGVGTDSKYAPGHYVVDFANII